MAYGIDTVGIDAICRSGKTDANSILFAIAQIL